MPLTRAFKMTVKARLERDSAFRAAMLREAVEALLAGDVDARRSVLRDYVNATVGFERLVGATNMPSKSVMRMLGPKGNPTANNLFAIIGALQRSSGVQLQVRISRHAA
jgi:DNA-binding phage protein